MASPEYRRLPGRGQKGGLAAVARTFHRLYVGKDHLLAVESSGWVEKYRRFYFADIQAFVVTRTKRAFVWNVILAILTIVPLGLALTREQGVASPPGIAWLSTAVVFFALLLVNFLRGPTCRATIQTAISHEPMPSLSRLRTAQKALAIVRPLIEQTQGALGGENLPARLAEISRGAPSRIIPGRALAGTHYLRHAGYAGALHRWTFGTMILTGALGLWDVFAKIPALAIAIAVLMGVILSLGIMAVVRQHESNTRPGLRGVTWAALGFVAVYYLVCYILMIVGTIKLDQPRLANDVWSLLKEGAKATPNLYVALEIVAAVGLPLGIAGMIFALAPKSPVETPATTGGGL